MNGLTRIFLFLLRLAIGLHFLFEGIEKIRSVDIIGPTEMNRPFSSLAYLREAAGPAGSYYRGLVGDPDQQALELFAARPLAAGEDPAVVPARQRIAPALEKAWDEYFQRFVDKYEITGLQLKETQARLDQAKDQAVRWLLGQTQNGRVNVTEIEKSFNGSAPVKIKESS